MAMIEQNISGVKLERLRKKAHRKTILLTVLPRSVFAAGVVLTLIYNGYFLQYIADGNWMAAGGAIGMMLGGVMLSFGVAALVYMVYLLLFWQKSYAAFNLNYKNKYALMKIREVPGFFRLKYFPEKGLSFRELETASLLPGRTEAFFKSRDYFEGLYHQIHFRSCHVDTYGTKTSIALFEGQVMMFSMFHPFKTSESRIQVFSRKENDKMKGLTFPEKIETENETFNQMFSVFAQDGHNAFYILTPKVLEDMLEFARIFPNGIYFAFDGQRMYVGCEQLYSPFDAAVDVPVEEQSKNIAKAADVIRRAGDILLHIEKAADSAAEETAFADYMEDF